MQRVMRGLQVGWYALPEDNLGVSIILVLLLTTFQKDETMIDALVSELLHKLGTRSLVQVHGNSQCARFAQLKESTISPSCTRLSHD